MINKINIGNLKNGNKICKCGVKAEYYIFLIENNKKSMHYKCKDCMKIINNIATTLDTITKN